MKKLIFIINFIKYEMRKSLFVLLLLITSTFSFAQEADKEIIMQSSYSSDNQEVSDILEFEGIQYLKMNFFGKELSDKTFLISVKEIWDGIVSSESIIMNSAKIGVEQLSKINDTVFNLRVISKLTVENKLKMTFKFPHFSTTK